MARGDVWSSYAPTYRAAEIQLLTSWIVAGASGSVVGLVGSGRSNLLRYLCEHPTALVEYLPGQFPAVVLVPVDLYDLPSNQLVDLYRTILHAFYWVRERYTPALAEAVTDLYREHRSTSDAFLAQTALYDLLQAFSIAQTRVVLVMNRFDRFCETSTPQMVNTLRSLRDRFKETLSYIVGMRQAVIYLPEPTLLGDMYELFDNRICYVGPLAPADSRYMLAKLMKHAAVAPSQDELESILQMSGGFPILLKAISDWWLQTKPQRPPADWLDLLLNEAAIIYRLERLWQGLTQEEQQVLAELHKQSLTQSATPERTRSVLHMGSRTETNLSANEARRHSSIVVQRLASKGWSIGAVNGIKVNGMLLSAFVEQHIGSVRGRLWFDESTGNLYQGQQVIENLTPMEHDILRFLITHPRIRHTSDTIIENAWPADENKHIITPNNLQVHISSIRKKIELNLAMPRYIITWHGRPGGYQCFPEGKPE